MNTRKLKAAQIKTGVYKALIKLINKRRFKDIYIEQICKESGISKVTFFKYFPRKEDVLLYYMRVWNIKLLIKLMDRPKEGREGLYFLFDEMAKEYINFPELINNFVAYLMVMKLPQKPFPVKHHERVILFPEEKDIESIEILSLDQLIEKFLLEGIFKKEITKTGDVKELSRFIHSILMGTVITTRLKQFEQVRHLFRHNLDHAIGSLV